MAIKHILFDIDDTLFPTSEFAEYARKNAIKAMIMMGLDESSNKLYSMLEKIIKEKGSNYENHFDILCNKLGIKENKSKYVAAAVLAYHNTKHSISPFPSVPRTLLSLKENYKIHIASEGNAVKQWDKLIRLGLSLFFENVFISEELKIKKSPKFFTIILKKLKAKPQECIMVGDKPDSDILYAKKVGIKTIRINSGRYKNIKSDADLELNHFFELPNAVKKLNSMI
ncbi:MAG: TIGR02253 family HAD-type hydrolase [Candidatus ainarchaeum sp.]|nr:TIGR02253 family HAD-type hydrolase [Candidatus ainarchaeum sp.]